MSGSYSDQIEQRRAAMKRREGLRNASFIGMMILLGLIFLGVLWWQRKHDPDTMVINVNTASASELAYLPEVGPDIAREIVKGRPYATPEDMLKVKGIGPKTLEKMRARLKF